MYVTVCVFICVCAYIMSVSESTSMCLSVCSSMCVYEPRLSGQDKTQWCQRRVAKDAEDIIIIRLATSALCDRQGK